MEAKSLSSERTGLSPHLLATFCEIKKSSDGNGMEPALMEEFVERRYYPCRHCHGNGECLMTPAEAERSKAKPAKLYDHRLPPSPDCPQCHGEGIRRIIIRDTRSLSPRAKAAFAGVKRVDGRAVVMFRENGVIREVAEA